MPRPIFISESGACHDVLRLICGHRLRAFVVVALYLSAAAARAQEPAQEFLSRAGRDRLWEEREWRLLLHYKPALFGVRSEARNPEFFVSPYGRWDPRAELEADVRALFQPAADPDQDVRCRFPLRSRWLAARLGLGADVSPKRACPKYDIWRNDLRAGSVTMIFASAHLNNPSSMYGHTFLRVDQRAHGSQEKLLDHAVNFAANADTENGILFAIYGLTGRYPGRFSAMPYYLKVQEYSNLESRDLWEYHLNLDSTTVDRLAAHVWELDNAEFAYYFFNKNCSYQLLPLLEAADPRLHLTDHWPLYVIPVDTVRAARRQPGLVSDIVYRPSRVTSMLWSRGRLRPEEVRLAEDLTEPSREKAWEKLRGLPKERQSLVLSSAADYLQYLSDFRTKREAANRETERRILVALGQTGVAAQRADVPAPDAPDAGHATSRVSAGYGFGDRRFLDVSLRLGLHDLVDPLPGYARDSQLEMFQVRLRHDTDADRNYVQSLDLVRILSLSPYDRWVNHPSWQVDTGLRTAPELDPRPWRTNYYGLTGGTGKALETHLLRREVIYALAQADAGLGGILRRSFRLGGGGLIGCNFDLFPRWRTKFEAGYLAYAAGDPRPVGRYGVESSLGLATDVALRVRLEKVRQYREAVFGLQWYF